ncbi:hypothetical protein DFP93_109119, partial [Aneurinibacillus soli]
ESVKEIRTNVQAFIQHINQDLCRIVNRLCTKNVNYLIQLI